MMPEATIIEWFVQQTGPVAVMLVVIWIQQQNHRAYMAREQENANVHREDKSRLITVLEQNTAAKTELIKSSTQLVDVSERLVTVVTGLQNTVSNLSYRGQYNHAND